MCRRVCWCPPGELSLETACCKRTVVGAGRGVLVSSECLSRPVPGLTDTVE